MTTLLIDNYDSFTFNIYQYLCELGADVKVCRNDQITVQECVDMNPVNVVISPGPGSPSGAGISMEVIKAFAGKVPILGVCLGHQSIFEVFGGTVSNAPRIMHGKVSPCFHTDKDVFNSIPQGFNICRYHSLAGLPETLPDVLEVTAMSYEDDLKSTDRAFDSTAGTIMGLRHKQFTIMGVQFHPESIVTDHGKKLLQNFLNVTGGKWE
jgi:anthranilate synthase/aminodeoxychorismate synthase-like glutamine amidotransferase